MKGTILLVMLALLGWNLLGNDGVPAAISPGSGAGVAAVESRCPTFSWSGVAWAKKYRVVVFGVEGERTRNGSEPALTAQPVLSEDIAGGGLSWTPSLSQGLAAGADYAWCVGALDADGAWAWSATRRFRVEQGTRSVASEENSAALKEKDRATSNSAADSSMENDTVNKDSAENIASPMGTEGTFSTFYGFSAGANNSSDSNTNSFFGSLAGHFNTNGTNNTFVGNSVGYYNTIGTHNTFMGNGAGSINTSGTYNTFIGNYSGKNNTIGEYNTFIGNNTGFNNSTGEYNTYMGDETGYENSEGSFNTFLGYSAGYESTGSGNVFIGSFAGYDESGSNKLYIDNSNTSSPLIYGDFSTYMVGINGWLGVGTQAPAYPMELKTTGRNAAIVVNRTDGAVNFINATTSYGQFGTVNNYGVRILANATWRMTLNTDNSLAMASGATCTAGGVWTNASSIALKQDVAPLNAATAAAALRELNPVTYAYKADASEKYVGFIAEEVPELVAMNDRKSLSTMDVVAVLTKVVQEQQKELSMLKAEMSALKKKVAAENQN